MLIWYVKLCKLLPSGKVRQGAELTTVLPADEQLSRVKLARVLQFWSLAMQEAYVMSWKLTSWQIGTN